MLKKLILLFFMFSTICFSVVKDEIGFFSEQEEKEINERVQLLEKQFDVDFQINLLLEEGNDENPNSLEKTVIINLLKTDERSLKLNLKFSNDLDVSEYKDDINELLNTLDILMSNGEYQDFIYELTANISDIINLITIEDKKIESRMQAIKIVKTISLILVYLLTIVLLALIIRVVYKKIIQKSNTKFCTNCNVRMSIFEKVEKKGKIIKIYKCHKCGETKQVMEKK